MSSQDRLNFQVKIKNTIDLLNEVYTKSIKYKLVFSLGDSVQGMFYSINAALGFYDSLKTLLYPHAIYGGIGYGEIYIDLEAFDSNMQDGPAYHNARNAIDICKKKDLEIALVDFQNDVYVNEIFKVISKMENRGSGKRKDVNNLVNSLFPYYQKTLDLNKYYQKITSYILSNIHNYDKINIDSLDISNLITLTKETDQKYVHVLTDTPLPQSLANVIGILLGTTRENIRQMIEVGEMNQIRNLKLICNKLLS